MFVYLGPLLFVIAWFCALMGWTAPGADGSTPFDEQALRWMLFLGMGWFLAGNSIPHIFFGEATAKAIGWVNNGFQYEVGFASLGIGLAGIFAAFSDSPDARVTASIAGGIFLLLAGLNHVREIFKDGNYAPGNTVILISDIGVPVSLLVLLISAGAIG